MALVQNSLGVVPITVLHRTLQIRTMVSVQVGEYPILVLQTTINPLRRITNRGEALLLLGGLGGRGEASGGGGGREDAVGEVAQRGLRCGGRLPGEHSGRRECSRRVSGRRGRRGPTDDELQWQWLKQRLCLVWSEVEEVIEIRAKARSAAASQLKGRPLIGWQVAALALGSRTNWVSMRLASSTCNGQNKAVHHIIINYDCEI